MPLTPGATRFEYRITRALSRGAGGTVYLAQDTLLDRPVAVKGPTAAAQAPSTVQQIKLAFGNQKGKVGTIKAQPRRGDAEVFDVW